MHANDEPLPGIPVAVGVLSVAILWAALARLAQPVVLDDAGRAVAGRPLELPARRIELNEAGAAELVLLPGIGPALGVRIVEDRRRRGAFGSIDDLGRVDGIGAMTVARIRDHAVVADTR